MRNSELSEGIEVFDSSNSIVGTSQIAAKKVSKIIVQTNIHKTANPKIEKSTITEGREFQCHFYLCLYF